MPQRPAPQRPAPQRPGALSIAVRALLATLLWLCALSASAQSRAWVDRDRIDYEDTTVLTLEIYSSPGEPLPDLSGIASNFRIVDQSVEHKVILQNGSMTLRLMVRLTLQPMRDGELEIPPLQLGSERTRALRVWVSPPRTPIEQPAPASRATPAEPVFIETLVDTPAPYVQQTVGYTVRLMYESGILIDGRLDHDPPQGATLQKVGEDLQSTRTIGSKDYSVLERRFLLIPERSGPVTVPAARFTGRAMGLFDSVFGDGSRNELRVRGNPVTLQVKPIPAAAPQPWLPLRDLRLRYLEAPKSLRVGESAAVTIEAVADGAIASQLPELALGVGSGAQLFPEPPQPDDRFVGDRPQATIVRRVMVLPVREGALRIAGPRIAWWDTAAGVARSASLPDIVLQVAPGTVPVTAAEIAASDAAAAVDEASPWYAWRPENRWAWAMLGLPLLWILAMGWGWHLWTTRRRQQAFASAGAGSSPAGSSSKPSSNPSSSNQADMKRADVKRADVKRADVKRASSKQLPANALAAPAEAKAWASALARGDVIEIARTLCAMAAPVAGDLDAVRAQLADQTQRAAVDALQRARWGDGDTAVAVAAMRAAFASGPRWRAAAAPTAPALLPPLYPDV